MDKLEHYRQLVRQLISERAKDKVSHGEISTEAVMDLEKDHYELLHIGWDGYRRIHGCALHVDIVNGKIWVQHD
ncbi:MAG TPA: element excision factor XisI family protein, partial [Blastocatellia bacterium]|nr:element excision factor XisI family protein [Blastocatellia bacterium]